MEDFFERLVQSVRILKPYLVGLIGLVALIQLFMSATIGGADRRQTIVGIFGLLAFAALIMYSDYIFEWIQNTFR